MAVTGRTSSFSESRFCELLTAATTPASQGELRRSISGEKYQRILTSGSGASLLPCDATMPRRNPPPRNNNTSAYRFHSATSTATGVPPIGVILQSLRKANAEIQIRDASFKKKESRPSPMELMEEIQRRCELRAKKFASIGQYHQSSSPSMHHQSLRSASPREPAPIIQDPAETHRASTHHIDEASFQKRSRTDDKDDPRVHGKSFSDLDRDVPHEDSMASGFQANPQPAKIGNDFEKNFLPSHGIFGVRFEAFVQIVGKLQLSIDAKCYSSQDFMKKRKDLGEFLRTRLNAAMSNGYLEELCSKFGVNSMIMSDSKQAKTHADKVFDETPQPIAKSDDEDEGKGHVIFNFTDEVVKDCSVQKTPALSVIPNPQHEVAYHTHLQPSAWEDQIEQAQETSFVIEMESPKCQPNELLDYCDQVKFLQPYEELKERIGVG